MDMNEKDVEKDAATLDLDGRTVGDSTTSSRHGPGDEESAYAELKRSTTSSYTPPGLPELAPITTTATARTGHSRHSHKSTIIEPAALHPLTDLSAGVIGWDSEDDPANPRNWPVQRKMSVLGLVSAITFISPLASSMFAPGVSFMNAEFHNSSTPLTSLVVSIYVLGWAIGPLFLSPLSELYGRRRVLDVANAVFTVWQIGCALAPNLASLIVFRLLAGIGGSGCLVIGGGVISDLFTSEQRGLATALFSLGPLFGPVVGPIAGGFVAQRVGWRWVFWILLAAGGVLTALIAVVNEETNPHVLLHRRVAKLRAELNRPELVSWYDRDSPRRSPAAVLKAGLIRPWILIFRSPISALMCTYMALVYGILYLLFTSLPLVFAAAYGFSPEISGLAYLGIGVGFFAGVTIQGLLSDRTLLRLAERNGGVAEPEMRLPLCAAFSVLLPISLLWYGWTTQHADTIHWIVPIVGMSLFGIGMMVIFVGVQTYMIDAFVEHAASAVAALTATRSILGAFLPMAGGPMFKAMGLGGGHSLLAGLALVMGGAVWVLYKYGKVIRERYPVRLD
ncbi:synaptic vesicle transporter [Geopyxis carbonaria]|nr:synaptic vesicle transporter [Geopyxis carbonaria]